MAPVTHLKSLQALEMAIREGSLKAAAEALGITSAAVGQRIRALEDYLGTDLLLRGRSGLSPTPELLEALADLRAGFAALERVTEVLDFQRMSEIHVVADPDWTELWLMPRLTEFRQMYPNVLFCINGAGDVPIRIGTPDLRITYANGPGEVLFRDVLIPVTGPDNPRRIAVGEAYPMEGMPLLHLKAQLEDPAHPGWPHWFDRFGQRETGIDRGVRYPHARLALKAVRENVGFLVCGLSLMTRDIAEGRIVTPFPLSQSIPAPLPYQLTVRHDSGKRPQIQKFVSWLRDAAAQTQAEIDRMTSA